MIKFSVFDDEFLELSWGWLNDIEIKSLTMTPDFTRQQQVDFFNKLKERLDYIIYGVEKDGIKIGVAGLKHIDIDNSTAEYWGYIGEKSYWGMGIGSVIIEKMVARAREIGIKKLRLKVLSENKRALSLYDKHGFVMIEKGHNIISMEKEI